MLLNLLPNRLRTRAASFFALAVLALALAPRAAHAQTGEGGGGGGGGQPLQTLSIYGSDAAMGTIDPNTDCSKDGQVTWLPAYSINRAHPWGNMAGTTSWISRNLTGESAGDVNDSNPEILDFRIRFYAPAGLTSQKLTFSLNPDNYGDIFLNGTKLNSAQIIGPTVAIYTVTSGITTGLNTIIVRLKDTGGWLGINYAIQLEGYATTGFQRLIAPPAISNVSSTAANASYTPGAVIPVQVKFNRAVTVTGTPVLTLETGANNRNATYASGSGTDTLTFNYTVQQGDASSDLEYLSTGALALNGGSIKATAADLQDANLTLPAPAGVGSLSANNAIVIASDTVAPMATAFTAFNPATSNTNLTSVTYRVTFTEPVTGVDAADFVAYASTGNVAGTAQSATEVVGTNFYDVVVGNITGDGTLFLRRSTSTSIWDLAGNQIATSGYTAQAFRFDHTVPTVAISTTAPEPTKNAIPLTITFSEGVSGLSTSDFAVTNGTVSSLTQIGATTWSATLVPTIAGTVTVSLPANTVSDSYTNGNTASNIITRTFDNVAPETAIDTKPNAFSNSPFAMFTFSSPDSTATFEVALDGSSFTANTSPTTYDTLTNGSHTFQVRARDPLGNIDATPATYTWSIDSAPPRIQSVARQSPTVSPTNADTLTFRVTFNEAVTSVDAADFKVTGTTATASVAALSTSIYDVTIAGGNLANLNGTVTLGFTPLSTIVDPSSNVLANFTPLSASDTTFSVINNSAPTNVALSTATINQSSATAGATLGTLTSSDPDASDTFTYSLVTGTGSTNNASFTISGSTLKIGSTALGANSYSVRVRTTDAGGLSFEKAFALTVVDDIAPETTIVAKPASVSTSANATFTFTSTETGTFEAKLDGAAFAAATTPLTLTGLADGSHIFQVRAKDAAGNLDATPATYAWTVDVTAPVLTLPSSPVIVEATSSSGAVANFTVTATDARDGSITPTISKASGSTFALGNTTVTVSAADAAGNAQTGSFVVTVRDTTKPVLTLPATILAEATDASGAVVNFTATATDAVTASPTITYSKNPGATFVLGNTTVNVTATDAAGNQQTGSFTVTVTDTTKPALTLPANITAEATGPAGAIVNFAASATDAVSGSLTIGYSQNPGSTFKLGTTTVTVTATDAAGNKQIGSFTVTVVDTIKPVLVLPADITTAATSANGAVVDFDVLATDAVGFPIIAADFEDGTVGTNSANYVAFNNTATANGWKFTGYGGYLNGNGGGFGPMTQDEGSQSVLVQAFHGVQAQIETANTFPVIAGATYTLSFSQASRIGGGALTYSVTLNGSGGSTEIFRRSTASGEGWARYTATYTAPTSGTYTLAFNTVNASGDATFFLDDVKFTSNIVAVATTPPSGSTFALGATTVNATVADAAGNEQTGTFTVTVNPTVATITLTTPAYTFDGTAKVATAATSPAGLPVTFTYNSGSSAAPIAAGTHAISATVSLPWISGSATGTLEIAKAPLTVSATAQTKVYGSADTALTFSITSGALFGGDAFTGGLVRTAGENVGTYAIEQGTLTAGSNYTLGFTGATLAITPKPASVTSAAATKVYGAADPVFTGTLAGFLAADNVTASYSRTAGENVADGPYTISAALVANPTLTNYAITTATAAFTITPAPLAIVANAQSKIYGAADPALTYSVTGLQFTDTAGSVLTGALTRVAGETVLGSPYAISRGTLVANSNYTLGYTGANLTITPATATIAVNGYTGIYDGQAHGATGTATGVGGANLASMLNLGASFTNVPGGTANWSFHDPAGNYLDASGSVTITLTKADATIAVTPYTVIYDGNAHVATGTAKGVSGETLAGLSLAGTTHTNVGTFTDTWTFTDATGNYAAASGTVTNTIGKAAATIAVTPYGVVYDGAAHTATGTITGVKGETLAGLSLTATTHTNAGSYSDTWTFTDVTGNYLNASGGIIDVISKAPATIALAPLAQMYDGTPRIVLATTTPASLAVTITYAGSTTAPTLPGSYAVVATITAPNYSGTQSGTLTVGVTAIVRHGLTINGDIDGSVQVLTAENNTFNGGAGISGDLLVPGTPTVRLNGKPTFGGTQDCTGAVTPTNYTVTLNGNALLRYLVRRTDPVAMPIVAAPALPTGTRGVNLNKSTDPIGAWATLKDLTLNGNVGNVAVPAGVYGSFTANGGSGFTLGVAGATTPSVYQFQSFTLNGNTALNIVGPVIIVLKNDLNVNANAGSTAHPEWLDLRIANGSLTLNGNVTFNGYVTAPSGTVTINGNSTLTGGLAADKLVVNGNGVLIQPGN